MNELAELKFDVDYKPSEIVILNEDVLAKKVKDTAEFYKSLVFTDDNIKEAKEARADLNKSVTQIDNARKHVKSEFNAPLDAFEEKMNKYKDQIKEVSETINGRVKSYEEEQRQIHLKVIQETIEQEAKEQDVDPNEIQIDSSWLNGGSFTSKGKPVKKVSEAIQAQVQSIVDERNQIKSEKDTVQQFAEMADVDYVPYVAMVDKGVPSSEIIDTIKQAIERKKKAEEVEKQRIEALKAEVEKKRQQEEQEALEAEKRRQEDEKFAEQAEREYQEQLERLRATEEDEKPAEVFETIEDDESDPEPVIDHSVDIMEFTLHIKGERQALFDLNKYMTAHGIEFKKVGNE